jgi:hypothetical protein
MILGRRDDAPNPKRRLMLTICAHHAWASEAGDYFQVALKERRDDEGSPYLLIQRQFEEEDRDVCYVETHDEEFVGHFRIRSARLGRRRCRMAMNQALEADVTLDVNERTFREIKRVLRIMIPHLQVNEEEAL